jgi:hypothetical protein
MSETVSGKSVMTVPKHMLFERLSLNTQAERDNSVQATRTLTHRYLMRDEIIVRQCTKLTSNPLRADSTHQ